MKLLLTLVALVMLVASASAYHRFVEQEFQNSDDVFRYVTTGEHQIYILFIYDRKWAANEIRHPMKARYDLEKRDLLKVIDRYGRNVHFSEIDVNSGDFTDLLQEMGIKTVDLDEYPVTVVIDDGHGAWVQGPREYHRISQIINDFIENPDSHSY